MPVNEITAPPDTDTAWRVGERLQGEFRTLIRDFPLDARTIGGMSGWLGVTKPICQRLLRAVRHRGGGATALSFFPGVRGLHQFLQAALEQGCDAGLVAAASAAVDRYSVLIDEHGGSQARLLAALESMGDETTQDAAATADRMIEARMNVFEGIRLVTRREFDTQVAVFLYRPCADDPARVDCVTAMGMIGIKRSAGSLPICPVNRFSYGTREEIHEADVHVAELGGGPVAAGAPAAA